MAGIKASESGDLAPVNNVASPMQARVPGRISFGLTLMSMNKKMKKTVFLTGATGNMGWAGFNELLKKKDRFNIRLIARPSRKNRKKLAPFMNDPAVSVVWGDLTRYEDVLEGVTGADFVLHVGGMVSPAADYYPEKTLKTNVTAAENIVKAVLVQPEHENIRVVYIGSVAQCGDRMPPFHWGEAGEPVYASKYDKYSVSKCVAERVIVDSGIRWWVSLRQTGILYPGIFRQINPTAFHVPIGGVLEWATVEDSGRVLANVVEDSVPDEFWNRFYNISSGEEYRMVNYDFENRLLKPLGISSVEKVFEPQWFATGNFHGMWYKDADVLENYLHFRANIPVDEYFRSLAERLPWYYSLARIVPSCLIKAFMKPLAFENGLGTQSWTKNDEEKLKAYYGSREAYENIRTWEQMRPRHLEKNLEKARQCGEVVDLPKGYDDTKSVYSLTEKEIQAAAEFRGGCFIGPATDADAIGKRGSMFVWECENGHRFTSSLEYVLLGGGWCPECGYDMVYTSVTKKNRFISAVLSPQSRG